MRSGFPGRAFPLVRTLAAPWSLRDGTLRIDLIGPRVAQQEDRGNEGSLVLRVGGGSGTLLLPGDFGGPAEDDLAGTPDLESAQALLVGHHGSAFSSRDAWCGRIRPRVAFISCGPRNRHGHPAPATLERLSRGSIEIHRTDREGTMLLRWTDDGMRYRCCGCGPWKGVL